jgi:ATP-dependent helicase/nuclease subunit A
MHEYRFGLLFTPRQLGLFDDDEEQILVNGSIDLLLDEGDSLTVVDYKTDSVKAGNEKEGAEVHRTQLELYKNAAEQIFQKPVKEITVFFLKTGVGVQL